MVSAAFRPVGKLQALLTTPYGSGLETGIQNATLLLTYFKNHIINIYLKLSL